MRKISRNFSLPPIKISNNSTQVDIKPFSISKTTNTINNQKSKSQFNKNKLQNNLLIYIKFPPLNDKEKQILTNEIISIKDTKNIALINPGNKKKYNYNFDYIFDENVDKNTFFEKGIKYLIDEFFEGKNVFLFNFVTINSGKTSISEIMPLILKEIFIKINLSKDNKCTLKYSLFEIYNDDIIDLLKFQEGKNKYLCLNQGKEKLDIIEGITEIIINSNKNILKIIKGGYKNINENKNNSFIIYQISLEKKYEFNTKYNKLLLIDSSLLNYLINENNINNNILTLEEIINNIFNSNSNEMKSSQHKNSKLLGLLKTTSLNDSKIVFISNLSSSIKFLEETFNNLKYLDKIKNKINEKNYSGEYNQKNELKNKVNQLKEKLKDNKEEGNILDINNKTYRNRNKKNINENNTFYYSESIQQMKNFRTSMEIPLKEKEETDNNILIKMMKEKEFQTMISELRTACNNQIIIKQKIIAIKRELDRKKIQSIKENNNKESNLENELNINMKKYKEYSSEIEKINNELNRNNNITEMQKYLLNLIMKNSSHKIQMLDNKYYNLLNMNKIYIQEEYISELEKQIQYRDDIFIQSGINLNKNMHPNFRELKNLKNDFLKKNKNNFGSTPKFKKLLLSSYKKDKNKNTNHFSISTGNIKIKNYFMDNNNDIKNKIIKYKYKKLSNDKSIYDNLKIQKEKNIYDIFKYNSDIINKKFVSYKKRKDMIFNDNTYDSDYLYKNKNLIKKELSKRNIKRKILLNKSILANQSIN